jgi:hypothetical protein
VGMPRGRTRLQRICPRLRYRRRQAFRVAAMRAPQPAAGLHTCVVPSRWFAYHLNRTRNGHVLSLTVAKRTPARAGCSPPSSVRRRLLARLLRKATIRSRTQCCIRTAGGPLVFEHACLLGCEGIVSKHKHSRYRSGRSPDWPKMKNPKHAACIRAPTRRGVTTGRGLSQRTSGGAS